MKRIDLVRLRRDALRPGTASTISWSSGGEELGSIGLVARADGLRLIYRARTGDGPWHDIDEAVPIAWTPTRFSGRRPWFNCPGCARRCRVLFGGARFRCRTCTGLRYGSQAETRADRATRGMRKIVRRLNPKAQCNDLPFKPKGMHWRTFERLAARHDGYHRKWNLEFIRRFGPNRRDGASCRGMSSRRSLDRRARSE